MSMAGLSCRFARLTPPSQAQCPKAVNTQIAGLLGAGVLTANHRAESDLDSAVAANWEGQFFEIASELWR